jgi:phosphate transport system permease protein
VTATSAPRTEQPVGRVKQRPGDRVFAGLTRGAGYVILVALAGVAVFLTVEGFPALGAGAEDLPGANSFVAYVWPLLFGTLLAALVALVIATPLALGVALVISHYAPRRLAATLGYLVDLLAAVPSVVYGLWGLAFLGPRLFPVYDWLAGHVGWFPLFAGPASASGRTILTAAIVLAIMVLPIITAITREIFAQTPTLHQEAALALGATRWEMLRLAVFPYARSGIVSAVMLGLGRALGETMAVAMVLSASGVVSFNLISTTNPSTIAANIALGFPEATGLRVNALIASGLVLFVITFVVNFAARSIVGRRDRKMA